jgi:NADPH:quinone reductase-like Zn-dependent oxidoreductase
MVIIVQMRRIMRSWVLTGEPGSPLRLEDRPEPELGPGQIRVRMHAASLNYRCRTGRAR